VDGLVDRGCDGHVSARAAPADHDPVESTRDVHGPGYARWLPIGDPIDFHDELHLAFSPKSGICEAPQATSSFFHSQSVFARLLGHDERKSGDDDAKPYTMCARLYGPRRAKCKTETIVNQLKAVEGEEP